MNRHTSVPSALRTIRLIEEAEPDATDALDDAAGGGLDDELPNEDGAPLPSHDSKFDALKSLAKRDLPTLRHLAALKKVHDSQANLTGKDASLAIQAILNRLDQINPAAAAQLGQKNWEPNALSWIELFDTIGDQKLGKYIGIKDHASIPTGSAIEAGTDDEPVAPANDDGEEGTAAPESDENSDGTGDTDEVEALLKKPAPTPSPAVKESRNRHTSLGEARPMATFDSLAHKCGVAPDDVWRVFREMVKSVGCDGVDYTAYNGEFNPGWDITPTDAAWVTRRIARQAKPSPAVKESIDRLLERESHTRTTKMVTEASKITEAGGYNSIDDIVASHGDRKVVAFIHNRHQERVPFTASLEDALHTFEQYSGDVADIISDWKTVESYGDLAQYVRGQQPERGSEED